LDDSKTLIITNKKNETKEEYCFFLYVNTLYHPTLAYIIQFNILCQTIIS
jgi:hypothetical protein